MIHPAKIKQKVAIASIFLSALIFYSSCKKDSDNVTTTPDAAAFSAATFSAASSSTSAVTLKLTGLKSDGGYSYKLGYALPVSGDSNTQQSTSTLRLFENGVELKQAHSVHQDIRNLGKGRFSHWGTALYFSASDNTNPATNGRVYTYTIGGSAPSTIVSPPANTTAPQSNNIVGYAMVNGSTTGGLGGESVTVSTLAQLKAALNENAAKIVYVSGRIAGAGNDAVYVKSNKSIIGKPGASIEGITLLLFTVDNVIIQDLTFKNYISNSAITVKFQSTHIWIDHCDFSTDRTHGWEYWGKDIAITRGSDYVTVSWNKFHDTNLSVLIAGGDDADNVADDRGKLHVTMHHNFWYNVTEREPSMCTGNVHMFNNYHLNNSGYSIGARAAGTVRTDNEYFANCNKPITTKVSTSAAGYISGAETNVYSKCGANEITSTSQWLPPYSYASALDAAENVPTIVQQGAGPRNIN